jgi:hexosaminidase
MTGGLLPLPVQVTAQPGGFALTDATTIRADASLADAATWLAAVLRAATRLPLRESDEGELRIVRDETLVEEAYRLEVTSRGATLSAGSDSGAFWGVQTLRQLLGPDAFRRAPVGENAWSVPACSIEDRPRFAWRGCLLDVARHFLPKDGVLRFLDLMAAHKLNVLHLHLTDDQGWRMQVRRYPQLTEVGGWRTQSQVGNSRPTVRDGRPHGGFYTQDDLREIVAYAGQRHITVLPEIDLPGHMQAAIAAYPELGNTDQRLPVWTDWGINDNVLNVEDKTLAFFRNVLDEVMDVFPSTYISLGGDEVPTTQWQASPQAQQRMRDLALRDEAALQSWFIGELAAHLSANGRRLVVWDELVESGLPDGALVQSWRGIEGGLEAIAAGHDVVMCPEQEVYLDHRQSERDDEPIPVGYARGVEDVRRFRPVPDGLDDEAAQHIVGAQAQVWTEHLDNPRRVDYATFPRLAAFAEAVWSGPVTDDFLTRLREDHLPRLDALGVEYRPLDGPHPWQTRPGVPGRPR